MTKNAYPKLKRKNVEKWIDALESGQFKQGRASLRSVAEDGERFCCLGVACELMPQARGVTESFFNLSGYRFNDDPTCWTGEIPHGVLANWLGITEMEATALCDGDGTLRGDAKSGLISMNDQGGKSFKQIARHLRSRFKVEKVAR